MSAPVPAPKRRRIRHPILLALGFLLAVPLAVLLVALLAMNGIARRTVEALGTDAMGVPVRLEKAQVRLAGGARLTGFVVGNPLPFQEVRSFRFERLDVETRLGALLQNPVEIRELVLVRPQVTLELRGGRTNWGTLIDNLSESLKAEEDEKKPGEPGDRTTFIIRRVRILNPLIRVRLPILKDPVTLALNAIELDRMGTSPGSASTMGVVLAAIYQALFRGELKDAGGIPAELRSTLRNELAEVAGAVGDLLAE